MSKRVAASVVTAIILAGCSLFTDLSGLDNGPSVADSGGASTSSSSGGSGTLPDGNASSTTSSSSTSSSSSTTSSSGSALDASPDATSGGPCVVTTTSAFPPQTVATANSGPDWATPENAKTQDGAGAIVSLTSSAQESRSLVTTNYGFNVPATAQIRGVTVTVRAKGTSSTEVKEVRDETIRLVPGGTQSLLGPFDEWSATFSAHQSGGPTTTWGLNLTPAIVNAPTFGVSYIGKFHEDLPGNAGTLEIDVISVAITYCN